MASPLGEARALGHRWFGEEHVLLAALAAPGDLQGRLDDLGLTHQAAVDVFAQRSMNDQRNRSQPSYHVARGRAQGLALGLDASRPAGGHYLMGALWEPTGPACAVLADLGVDRGAVLVATRVSASRPANLLPEATQGQVVALGGNVMGTWHLLLAFLAHQPDPVAGQAFDAVGLTYADCFAWTSARRDLSFATDVVPREAEGTLFANSRLRENFGRAEGLAAARGAAGVRSEHGLIAYLWEQPPGHMDVIAAWGGSEPAVVQALAERGVQLPATPRPERRR